MKKALSFGLLLIFFYNIVGYYPAFLLMQNIVKEEMEQRIKSSVPTEDLTALHFTEAEYANIQWRDHGQEFVYNGDMMDLVKERKDGKGNIIVYAINDKKERKLYSEFNEQVKKNTPVAPSNKPGSKSVKLYSDKYFHTFSVLAYTPALNNIFSSEPGLLFTTFIKNNPSPPPKS